MAGGGRTEPWHGLTSVFRLAVRRPLLRQGEHRFRPVRRAGDHHRRVDLRRDPDGGRRLQQ